MVMCNSFEKQNCSISINRNVALHPAYLNWFDWQITIIVIVIIISTIIAITNIWWYLYIGCLKGNYDLMMLRFVGGILETIY